MVGKLRAYADKYIAAGSRRPTDTAIATIEYRSKVKQERLPPIDAWLKQHGG
jgi:aminopeptidase N